MALMLLIGSRHSGKTSACRRLAALAQDRGLSVAGIISPAVYEAGECSGYQVIDLSTRRSARLASVAAAAAAGSSAERIGEFSFTFAGLALGREALKHAAEVEPQLVIVDEVGPLELAGGGWAVHLDALARRTGATIFAVRASLVGEIARHWGPVDTCDLRAGVDVAVQTLLRWVAGALGDAESSRFITA